MDQIEKWLVDQAHLWHPGSLQEFAVLETATKWHEEGATVLAKQNAEALNDYDR